MGDTTGLEKRGSQWVTHLFLVVILLVMLFSALLDGYHCAS